MQNTGLYYKLFICLVTIFNCHSKC